MRPYTSGTLSPGRGKQHWKLSSGKSMCALMESVFYGTGTGRSIFTCVIYTIIFVSGSLVATAVKGRDR